MLSRRKTLHQAVGVKTFSAITHCNYACLCKQIGNIFWCFKVIWLMHYSFIQIGRIQTYYQLEISKLIFPFHKNKTVDPRSSLVNRLQHMNLYHLIYFLLERPLKMYWDWSARGLLGCNTRINLNMVWGPGKLPIPSNTSE